MTGFRSSWFDPDDPVLSIINRGSDKYANYRSKWFAIEKKYGQDLMGWWNKEEDDFDATQFDEGEEYTSWQLGQIADELLRQDVKREMCRKCGKYGEETGEVESLPQADEDGNPVVDDNGDVLYVDFPELACEESHRWYRGEGKARGIAGKNPILFENHLQDRRRREIYTSIGTPDPSIERGLYNRSHPQGRKVNTEEQRKKHGASYYR